MEHGIYISNMFSRQDLKFKERWFDVTIHIWEAVQMMSITISYLYGFVSLFTEDNDERW